VYLGTPEVAVPPLRALHAAGFDIALVITGPDKRRGRGKALGPSPVKSAAGQLGLTVTDTLAEATEVGADLGVVVAYGRIIPTAILERLPMVNLHFSILPRWRGAAPVERAILAGDTQTGVCLMGVAPELDAGAIHRCDVVSIGDDETLNELRGRLVELGASLLVEELTNGLADGQDQCGEVTYAAKIEPEEHRLDVTLPARQLHRVVRLGRAWCTFRNKRLKILSARVVDRSSPAAVEPGTLDSTVVVTGDGLLELIEVQPEGRKPMTAAAWLNGVQPAPGERLG